MIVKINQILEKNETKQIFFLGKNKIIIRYIRPNFEKIMFIIINQNMQINLRNNLPHKLLSHPL